MDSFDGSGNFQGTYHLECNEEDMEILYYGRKIRKTTNIFHKNNRLLNECKGIFIYKGRKISPKKSMFKNI